MVEVMSNSVESDGVTCNERKGTLVGSKDESMWYACNFVYEGKAAGDAWRT